MHIQQNMQGDLKGLLPNLMPGRLAREALKGLQRSVDPYLFFWDEWVVHEDCNLLPGEVRFISRQMAAGFKPGFKGWFLSRQAISDIRLLTYKLDAFLPVYKNAVILEFLFLAIRMSKDSSGAFFDGPICLQDLSKDMKTCLKAFGKGTIRQIFTGYSGEQLSFPWVFDKIKKFYIAAKAEGFLTHNAIAYDTDMV